MRERVPQEQGVGNYVLCPQTISSPAPPPGAQALGIEANMTCGAKCQITRPAGLMEIRCPHGHHFFATEDQILTEGEGPNP